MNRKKGIYSGIAIVVIAAAALLIWRQPPPSAPGESIAESPPESDQAGVTQPDQIDEVLLDSPGSAVLEPSLVPSWVLLLPCWVQLIFDTPHT